MLGLGWYDRVDVQCQVENCKKIENRMKGSALKNFERNNGTYKCRSHSVTEEGRKKISIATSYKRSPETKKLMSVLKKDYFKTDKGQENRKKLAKKAVKEHSDNRINKSKRKVLYISAKNDAIRVCNSSYEFVACEDFWEKDSDILSYETQLEFNVEGREHSLDVLIQYKDGSKKLIEIKPKKRICEFKEQIKDCNKHADVIGAKFELWTESRLKIANIKAARDRADAYRKEHYLIDYAAYRQQKYRDKANRHYKNKIAKDKVVVFCEFCDTYHSILRKSYDRNIVKNERFICIRENGFIVGKLPKNKKDNPYKDVGMKQCKGKCDRILSFDCFGKDKSRNDGYNRRCSECRQEECKQSKNKLN